MISSERTEILKLLGTMSKHKPSDKEYKKAQELAEIIYQKQPLGRLT